MEGVDRSCGSVLAVGQVFIRTFYDMNGLMVL